jgi:predicted molibdopterin-dependent oxidoreductase YjgC
VLPTASLAERDGTLTNTERRVQLLRQAIAPIADSRPDWWIACQVALKMGARGFDFEQLRQIMDEIARLNSDYSGIWYQRLEHEAIFCPCPHADHPGTPVLHVGTFARGKGRFSSLIIKPEAQPLNEEYPLMLITESDRYRLSSNSAWIEGLKTLRPEELVEINPADAAKLSIRDNEVVRIVSPHGQVEVKAKITEALPPGVVCVSGHFPKSPVRVERKV